MRFSTVAFTLFGAAASASASTLVARQSPYPACANPCVANPDLGGCDISDTHCLCTNPTFVSSTTACIEKACSGTDLQTALTVSQGLCLSVGVTLTAVSTTSLSASTTPTSPAASTTPTSPAASTTPTSPAASTTPSSTGTGTTGAATTSTTTTTTSGAGASRPVSGLLGLVAAALVALSV